jgi:small-conductance mechanosensitive channel
MHKILSRSALVVFLGLLGVGLAGLVLTSDWTAPKSRHTAAPSGTEPAAPLVDKSPLETAQKLAALAETSEELQLAQTALRVGDHAVDLAFAAALRDASEHPAPLTTQAREIAKRVAAAEAQVNATQERVTRLTETAASATSARKDDLRQQLELAQAQLDLDQDELEDARQDLIRAGGDTRSRIQKMLDDHEAGLQHSGESAQAKPAPLALGTPGESPVSRSLLSRLRAWNALRSTLGLLQQAEQESRDAVVALARSHDQLERAISQKKSQARAGAPGSSPNATDLAALRRLSSDQKSLAELDKRAEDEKSLSEVYADWREILLRRQRSLLHGVILSLVWTLLIICIILIASRSVDHFFGRVVTERTRLHTLRAVVRFAVQAVGVLLVLLVVLGPPNQLATIVAFAGAGLTVALKDFIVAFFGWFVLMGRNGIRVGDWVEINGVGGEVIEISLFHTVLLETGNWTDAGHPTGRKVTFVNSFAIERHFFNFSTSGQWLWDEVEMVIPAGREPSVILSAVQKIVTAETQANARLAEGEWQRMAPTQGSRTISAAPAISLRPTLEGIHLQIRYITRASERSEVRGRLYRAVIELLHGKDSSVEAEKVRE